MRNAIEAELQSLASNDQVAQSDALARLQPLRSEVQAAAKLASREDQARWILLHEEWASGKVAQYACLALSDIFPSSGPVCRPDETMDGRCFVRWAVWLQQIQMERNSVKDKRESEAVTPFLTGFSSGCQARQAALAPALPERDIIQLLQSPDWNVHHRALLVLEQKPSLSPKIVNALVQSLRFETMVVSTDGPVTWNETTRLLVKHRDETLVPLRDGLRSADASVVRHCAFALSEILDAASLSLFHEAITREVLMLASSDHVISPVDLSTLRMLLSATTIIDPAHTTEWLTMHVGWQDPAQARVLKLGMHMFSPYGPVCDEIALANGNCLSRWKVWLAGTVEIYGRQRPPPVTQRNRGSLGSRSIRLPP
jgi:hypothetical protein